MFLWVLVFPQGISLRALFPQALLVFSTIPPPILCLGGGVLTRILSSLAVFTFAFTISYLSASHFAPVSRSDATSGISVISNNGGLYYANITSAGSIDLSINSTPDGAYKVGKDTLTIDTNSTTGYKLYLSTINHSTDSPALPSTTPANSLISTEDNTKYIQASTGTTASPTRLAANTWGYTTSRTASSQAPTTYTDTDAAPTAERGGSTIWKAVPIYGSEDLLYTNTNPGNTGSPAITTNTVDVYYGANASTALPSGTYSNTVVYTAIVEGNTPGTSSQDLTISPTSQDGLAAGQTMTINTSFYTGFDASNLGTITVTIGGNNCTNVTPSINSTNGNLVITCNAPAQTAAGTYTVTVNITKYNKTYTLADAYEYRLYNVTIVSSGSGLSLGASSVPIEYGGSNTVTITPSSGYKISGASCTNGYTLSPAANGQTAATTFTISNNNQTNDSTCTFTGAANTFSGVCSATSNGGTFTWNGTEYIKLADGNCWTKSSQGTATWANASSLCSGKGTLPTAQQFDTLLSYYGGSANSSYGSPYGYYANSAALYNATGWSGGFWSSTEYASRTSNAWNLNVYSSSAYVNYFSYGKTSSLNVVCIGS